MTMTTEKYAVICFLSCLIAIVVLVCVGAYMSANGRPAEALGIGGAVTGLIGVIGTFKPRTYNGPNPEGNTAE